MRRRFQFYCAAFLTSGLLWTAAAGLCIEARCRKTLPGLFFSHDVDRLLYDLQTSTYDAGTIVLGDSVGRQITLYLTNEGGRDFLPLTTNGALQMAGQYYILKRYLERNRAPEHVFLLKHRPLRGNLNRPATENYVQRCFTRWNEIAEMTWKTGSLSFGLRSLSYRLAPAKYRLHLQALVPGLPELLLAGAAEEQTDAPDREWPLQKILSRFAPEKSMSVSEYYFLKMIDLCSRADIRLGYLPCPMDEKQWAKYQTRPAHVQQVALLKEISREYPGLKYQTVIKTYPASWFIDGVHLKKKRMPQVAADYGQMMDEMMQP